MECIVIKSNYTCEDVSYRQTPHITDKFYPDICTVLYENGNVQDRIQKNVKGTPKVFLGKPYRWRNKLLNCMNINA